MRIKQGYLYSLGMRGLNTFRSRLTVNYMGLENIIERSYEQTIYASNHPSRFDPMILIPTILHYSQNKNKVMIPATQWIKEKFHHLDRLRLFEKLAIIFVGDDKEKNKAAIKKLEDHLRTYKHVLIFPEGWYQRDGKMRPGMYGSSSIALHCATPTEDVFIVPVSLTYYMKPKPKKRESVRGWFHWLRNIDEYIMDTLAEAKQYYHAEIDMNFGKPISVNKIKAENQNVDEAIMRRTITNTLVKEITSLSVINANQLLAQYFLQSYAQKQRVHDSYRLHEDMETLVSLLKDKNYFLNKGLDDISPTLEKALELFEQHSIIKKKEFCGSRKYIVDKEYLLTAPDPLDPDYQEKNFLQFSANQLHHLPDVVNIVGEVATNY